MYKSIHTKLGLQLLSQAQAMGTQIRITHMAVGDGKGFPISLDPNAKQLVRERYRTTINRLFQDPENENLFTAEMIIPLEVGGFVMREIGMFDSNGNMLIVGNLPATDKPVQTDGLFSGTVFRIPFLVSNADIIELKVDPNVVTATHSWIINTITPGYLLPGGTTGQVLKKHSNANGDVRWENAVDANVFVDTIEEEQELVADQTDVMMSVVSTVGLAVYVNGERITHKAGADGWQVVSHTEIKLGKAYAAGSKILLVQNEPAGSAPYPLAKAKNLSDVEDKTAARSNLDVYSKSEAKANGMPAGAVCYFAMNTAPAGFLKANGAEVSRAVYADLFAAIGVMYGAGDGINTFNVPDGRAEFIRGFDDGRGIDNGRKFASRQSQQVQYHKHVTMGEAFSTPWIFGNSNMNYNKLGMAGGLDWDNRLFYTNDGSNYDDAIPNAYGVIGDETRPRNIAWLCCIKY